MYRKFFKRFFDIVLSFTALTLLSPILLILIIVGAVMMGGNPFFTQLRPGKDEKIFKMLKFRTMSNAKDAEGNLLPDEVRLNKYGRFLRATSLDELPELINILVGHMSIIGPRPLLVHYLPYYTQRERLRHSIRPGLTGYAQSHGRNSVSWDDRFALDVYYVENLSFRLDLEIILKTVGLVLSREGTSIEDLEDFDVHRKRQQGEVE